MTGGAVGGLIALFAQRWRFTADRWSDSADELSGQIIELADRASEFWLTDQRTSTPQSALSELRIKGGIERLNALKLAYQDWCRAADAIAFESEYAAFIDAISGGAFTSKSRKRDDERAFLVQATAADVVVRIRTSLHRGVTLKAELERRLSGRGKTWKRVISKR